MSNSTLMRDSSYKVMALIHDNPLRRTLSNPTRKLEVAGVTSGQHVLEVGCGPGFFTLPIARVVGPEGRVYAIDLAPLAIEDVKRRLQGTGLTNVEARVTDAADTGLPDRGVDTVILFGVVHRLNLDDVLPELHRVLRPSGILAVQTFSPRTKKRIVRGRLFIYLRHEKGVMRFRRNDVS